MPVPEPSDAAVAENDAEQKSMRPIRFTDNVLGIIKHGPTMVEAAHVGEPSLEDPKRTLAPDVSKENVAMFKDGFGRGQTRRGGCRGEPDRAERAAAQRSAFQCSAGSSGGRWHRSGRNDCECAERDARHPSGNAVPAGTPGDPNNALVKPVGPNNTVLPPVDKPAEAPIPVNDIKPGTSQQPTQASGKEKKPKVNLDEQSSSKKKKKKGLGKLNPF